MSRTRSFYSVVQYVPDAGRAEAANVGVVLFVPTQRRIEIRTSPTLSRVRRFFAPGKLQWQRIQVAIEALINRLVLGRDEFQHEAAFAQFVAARADFIRLTTPRPVMLKEPLNDPNDLYSELVGDCESTDQLAPAEESLPRKIAEVLGRLEGERRVWTPGSIEIPMTRRRFDVSFAYQNGIVNDVRAEALSSRGKIDSKLEKLGFNGQLIHEHPANSQSQKLVVLSSAPDAGQELEDRFEKTLSEFHVRFVPYHRAEDFADEIAEAAH